MLCPEREVEKLPSGESHGQYVMRKRLKKYVANSIETRTINVAHFIKFCSWKLHSSWDIGGILRILGKLRQLTRILKPIHD